MLQAGYTAVLGMKSQQQRLDTIGNNVANVNTTGFKATSVNFKDTLYETIERPVQPQEDDNLRYGHGTLVSSMDHIFSRGMMQITDNNTDFMIDGDGFFAIESPEGEEYYTRDGNFQVSEEEGVLYLVTAGGYYVMDTNGERIEVQGDFLVNAAGEISASDEELPYTQIQVVRFPSQRGLGAVMDNMYEETPASGTPEANVGLVRVHQGALESSNVNLASEMTKLIRTQRAFSFAARALTTADEMDQTAIQLK